MQWLALFLWSALARYGARRPARRLITRVTITLAIGLSMLGQLWLLRLDCLLTVQTGLPLHLCGMMGVMSVPMLWTRARWLYHFSLLLGAPCAFLALCFPAVIGCSQPVLMSLWFNRLHALIVCAALFRYAQKEPPPRDARASFLVGNGYLLLTALFNRALHSNYLFLSAAPAGTPLAVLFARGNAYYLCSLELLCMLVMRLLLDAYHPAVRRALLQKIRQHIARVAVILDLAPLGARD